MSSRNIVVVTGALLALAAGVAQAQPAGWKEYAHRDARTGTITRYWHPAEWAATGQAGMAETWSAQGEMVTLGLHAPVTTPLGWQRYLARMEQTLALSGLPPAQIQALLATTRAQQAANPIQPEEFHDPAGLVTRLLPKLAAKAGKQVGQVRIVEIAALPLPEPNPTGIRSALFQLEFTLNGVPRRCLASASTAWVQHPDQWMFHYSLVQAPAARFEASLPAMFAVWQSYQQLTVRTDWAHGAVRARLDAMEKWARLWGQRMRE